MNTKDVAYPPLDWDLLKNEKNLQGIYLKHTPKHAGAIKCQGSWPCKIILTLKNVGQKEHFNIIKGTIIVSSRAEEYDQGEKIQST